MWTNDLLCIQKNVNKCTVKIKVKMINLVMSHVKSKVGYLYKNKLKYVA